MKILVSAVACNPYLGSENYFGWAAVNALSKDHDVWVITSSRNRADLAKAEAAGLIPPNVRFVYAGSVSDWMRNPLFARVQSWKEYLHFAKDSLTVAKELHHTENFDLVQHVTYSTWRVASPMWQLGIPFVYGPIAGNEPFPFRLFSVLSLVGAAFELARNTSNFTSRFFPKVRSSVQNASHIFAITTESKQLMTSIRGSDKSISHLSPGFYSAAKASEFSRFAPEKQVDGVLRLYAAGNLGGQKCIAIALQALALVKMKGVDFRYHLGAGGPEIAHLKKLAAKLNLAQEVIFGGAMAREDYQRELGRTHIYLLPSMRETVGLTMMEAMLAGCVPIVADNGGPKITVNEDCGYKIAVTTPKQMAEDIAKVIVEIDRDRQIIATKGRMASARICEAYTEDHYRKTVNGVFQSLVAKQT